MDLMSFRGKYAQTLEAKQYELLIIKRYTEYQAFLKSQEIENSKKSIPQPSL